MDRRRQTLDLLGLGLLPQQLHEQRKAGPCGAGLQVHCKREKLPLDAPSPSVALLRAGDAPVIEAAAARGLTLHGFAHGFSVATKSARAPEGVSITFSTRTGKLFSRSRLRS